MIHTCSKPFLCIITLQCDHKAFVHILVYNNCHSIPPSKQPYTEYVILHPYTCMTGIGFLL